MYLIVILSFLINPLAAHGMQWEHNACDEMQQMAEHHSHHKAEYPSKHNSFEHSSADSSQHDCCEKEHANMQSQQSLVKHNCDTCSDCQAQFHTNGCIFLASLFSESIFRQHDYLSIRAAGYPTPLQESVIPPIA